VNYLATGNGLLAATASVIAQDPDPLHHHGHRRDLGETRVRQYLFAPAFFWEDVVSMAVIALHTAYLAAGCSISAHRDRAAGIALAAYATYVINAAQFLLKLRAARRDEGGDARTPTQQGEPE
jgi:3-vinyl bacteriochlorophyllide hydratase